MQRLFISLLSLLLVFIGIIFYRALPKNQVVLLDSHALRSQLIRQLAEHHATDAQVSASTQQFKNKLGELLTHYATQNKVVILERSQVLAGGKDITLTLKEDLAKAMRTAS